MRTPKQRLIGFLWFITVLIFISSMIALAFVLTGYLYRAIHWQPPLLFTHITNALLGLFFGGSLVGISSRFARARGWIPEMNVFAPVLDALERIARGDFSV